MVGKWHLGFFEWAYTPTYRGFDSHYGFYTGCGDHYTHERLGILDLRDNTAAVRDMNGTYSANLFTKVRSTIYPFIKICFQFIMKRFTQFCGRFPYRSAYAWNSGLRCSDKWKHIWLLKIKTGLFYWSCFLSLLSNKFDIKENASNEFMYVFNQVAARGFCVANTKNRLFWPQKN